MSSLPRFAAVESLDARVISRFPCNSMLFISFFFTLVLPIVIALVYKCFAMGTVQKYKQLEPKYLQVQPPNILLLFGSAFWRSVTIVTTARMKVISFAHVCRSISMSRDILALCNMRLMKPVFIRTLRYIYTTKDNLIKHKNIVKHSIRAFMLQLSL